MTLVLALLVLSSAFLLVYGLNLIYLSVNALLTPRRSTTPFAGEEPLVCVQLPIFNEHHVATRVINAVAAFDWPLDRLEIQVLDDSDDDTVEIVGRCVEDWRRRGRRITHVRRGTRAGYKAGALAHGMGITDAAYLAVFDADFAPEPDFLRRTMGAFADPEAAFVQARWGHLNERYSPFTALQALMVDFHFQVEQLVRPARGFLTNFTGSAGIWRRAAIEDAGGWSAATLTEDLDLSYRAQLRGWGAVYCEDVVVRQELPVDVNGYRGQQARWATGSFQTARRLLPAVFRSGLRPAAKLQAALHLLAYLAPMLMLLQIACYPLLILSIGHGEAYDAARLPFFVSFLSLSPTLGILAAQARLGRTWWRSVPGAIGWSLIGAGTSYTVLRAFLRAFRSGGRFVRTPKYRIEASGQDWQGSAYVRLLDPVAPQEAALGLAVAVIGMATSGVRWWLPAVYAFLFAAGLLGLAGVSLYQAVEVLTLRRLGRGAFRALRAATPSAAVFGVATVLLLVFARLPDPFEDSYQHWLMAANLASTGRLVDPLFNMQDTWLPGYQVAAAALLKAFGLWRLDLLKLFGAGLGLGILAAVHELAPNRRQGRIAVLLLAMNPVFLLVSGSAVAEPLLTLLLVGAALAALRGRPAYAALLAMAACLVGTKAWLWVGAIAMVSLAVRTTPSVSAAPSHLPPRAGKAVVLRFAWFPALLMAALLQLAFAPATHSAARGGQELASAVIRGSALASPAARLWQLLGTFGLATIPTAALALPGLAAGGDPVRRRWLHLPALLYLGAVVMLVAAGVYTGSHRYLYPALPSLALLAAAALDRAPRGATVVSAGASALLLLGFIPVFQGFAADNRGLQAAGLAAARVPGALLTDSPVAAYFSGKPPTQIAGSLALPSGRLDAVSWLRRHGFTSLVIEDVDYYQAKAVFPDLAAGRPDGPFLGLGDEGAYTVAGGKQAYVYELPRPRSSGAVSSGIEVSVAPVPGEGKTAGLGHGPYLVRNGHPLLGEGMGLGVPIVRFDDGWWYPGNVHTEDVSSAGVRRWTSVFSLDRTGGDSAHGYRFVSSPSRGQVQVTYTLGPDRLTVAAQVLRLDAGARQLALLNEESAAFDDYADATRTLRGSEFGRWLAVAGGWGRVRDGGDRVEFGLLALPGLDLHAGRELGAGLDWAGLDYLLAPDVRSTSYEIRIQEAR